MDQYKKIIKRRMLYMSACAVVLAPVVLLNYFYRSSYAEHLGHIYDFVRGTQAGLFLGYMVVTIIWVVRYKRMLCNETALKKQYNLEHDEREREIYNRTGVNAFWMSLVFLTIATIIAGFYSKIVFCTLGVVLLAQSIICLACKLYFKMKL